MFQLDTVLESFEYQSEILERGSDGCFIIRFACHRARWMYRRAFILRYGGLIQSHLSHMNLKPYLFSSNRFLLSLALYWTRTDEAWRID